MEHNCVDCNKKGKFSEIFNKILCNNCKKAEKYTLITLTNSKKEFLLKDDDLKHLQTFPKKSAFGPSTYYLRNDVIFCASVIHKTTPENLKNIIQNIIDEKLAKKEENYEKRIRRDQSKKDKRKNLLIKELQNVGLEYRSDSILCDKYINGNNDYTIEYIVNRMCEMKYLFEYCNMTECKDIAYKEYCEELNAGYFPDCSVFDSAERIALQKYSGGKYPDVFPWIK
jgi:hypothetical protein